MACQLRSIPGARWKGTVPWRLVMGALALVITLSAFLVAPFMPGGSGPAPAARSGQNLGARPPPRRTPSRAPDADASSWAPQPATYGTGSLLDQPVTMSDGTVLRADVYFPTTAGTSTPATGPFPVLLQQTPYGKAFIVYASAIANTNVDYLVDRGYIVVIADVRGTGDSGGTFDLFDPVQSTDGVTLANWAAQLPQRTARSACSASPTWASTSSRRCRRPARTRRSRRCSPSSRATTCSPTP